MVDWLAPTPPLFLALLHFGVMALIATSLLNLWRHMRHVPIELIRLWVFRELPHLRTAFTAMGIGFGAGLMVPALALFGIETPFLWYIGWAVPWALGSCYGFYTFTTLGRTVSAGGA